MCFVHLRLNETKTEICQNETRTLQHPVTSHCCYGYMSVGQLCWNQTRIIRNSFKYLPNNMFPPVSCHLSVSLPNLFKCSPQNVYLTCDIIVTLLFISIIFLPFAFARCVYTNQPKVHCFGLYELNPWSWWYCRHAPPSQL